MPEIHFQIQLPDGTQETCYSPSLIVKEYFTPDQEYLMADFLDRSRTALNIASDRVKAKYGRPCGLALGQLRDIESIVARYSPESKVKLIKFIE